MVRKFLLIGATILAASGTAFAADLPSREAPPVFVPPVPIFTWTGFYIGGHVGYQFGRDSAYYSPGIAAPYAYNPSGVVGGLHAGYNYQVNQIVFGIEGDVDGSSYSNSFAPLLGGIYTTREPIEGSIRGRLGYAFDRILLYATGGAAFGDFHTGYSNGLGAFDSFSRTRVGWTAGAGIEYALTNNWSVRGEYRYTDYGRLTDLPINTLGGVAVQHHETDNRVLVGFSYKFDTFSPPGAVVARY